MTKSKIYFISDGNGYVKIGKANNVYKRFNEMGNHPDWKILGCMYGGYKEERELHKKFEHLNIRGEWFNYNTEIKEFITQNKNNPLIKEDLIEYKNQSKKRMQERMQSPEYQEYVKKYQKEYRETTRRKEYTKEYNKKYKENNKENIKKYQKEYRAKNKENHRIYQIQWRAKKKAEYQAYLEQIQPKLFEVIQVTL